MKLVSRKAQNIEQLRIEVKDLVRFRVRFAIEDVRTYVWAKNHPDLARDQQLYALSGRQLGGGNFSAGLVGLVLLEFCSGVYAYLKVPSLIVQQSDVDTWKKKLGEVGCSLPMLDELGGSRPKKHRIKEAGICVWHLACELKSSEIVDLGLPLADKEEFRRVWGSFRNKLAHLFAPSSKKALSGVSGRNLNPALDEARLVENPNRPFTFQWKDEKWILHGEKLVLGCLPLIEEWLIRLIDSCEEEETLSILLGYIRLN